MIRASFSDLCNSTDRQPQQIRPSTRRLSQKRMAQVAIALTATLFSVGTSSIAQAIERIDWRNLVDERSCEINPYSCDSLFAAADERPRLRDFDEIRYSVTPDPSVDPGQVELGFRSRLEWWKEIKVLDANGKKIVSLEADNLDSRMRRTTLNLEWLKGGKIVFVKEKGFSVRKDVYEMPLTEETLQRLAGRRLVFTWVKD